MFPSICDTTMGDDAFVFNNDGDIDGDEMDTSSNTKCIARGITDDADECGNSASDGESLNTE